MSRHAKETLCQRTSCAASLSLLLCFLRAAFIVQAHPYCLSKELPVIPENPLRFCPQFNAYPGACCTSNTEIGDIVRLRDSLMPQVTHRNVECFRMIQTILCSFCDPLSGHIFGMEKLQPQSFPPLCAPFCSRFYNTCADIELRPGGEAAARIPGLTDKNSTLRLRDVYPTEEGYCRTFGSLNDGHCCTDAPDELRGEGRSRQGEEGLLPKVSIKRAFSRIDFRQVLPNNPHRHIVDMQFAPLGSSSTSNLTCVVFQTGQIVAFEVSDFVEEAFVFLDIGDRVVFQDLGESGLIGMAFDPNYESNRLVYIKYTPKEAPVVRVSRFRRFENATALDPKSERIILETAREAPIHHGGSPVFGSDGLMFLPVGDSMAWGVTKPDIHPARDLGTLRGKILRLNLTNSASQPDDWTGPMYDIPEDNPFAQRDGARPEIWSMGVRNPWRLSFDRSRKELWVADVGSFRYDEINLAPKGSDLGWNRTEADYCSQKSAPCSPDELETFQRPVYAHPNMDFCNSDDCRGIAVRAIVGGFWYRGSAVSVLFGKYIYCDFETRHFYLLHIPDRNQPFRGVTSTRLLLEPPPNNQEFKPASFAEDNDGEIYILDWLSPFIYRIESLV